MEKVRTRFAPSPTGYMHIGNLRTALYAYLYARHYGGTFVLRIEDTDQKRFVEGATEVIYETLKATGLRHDEGPDIGGPYAPYVQSERKAIYEEYAKKLVESGHAYYCFCKKDDTDEESYGHHCDCASLAPEIVKEKLKSESYVIRQKIPRGQKVQLHDEVFGDIVVDTDTLDDQVLLKSDKLPTYNFANVIDDHLMNITHVIRGKEYISSAPKYELLYEALGWKSPVTMHVSTIMGQNPDGSVSKLSKRHGSVSFAQLVEAGYLPEAILNYTALLGWSPKMEREVFSLAELIELFTADGLVKADCVFDYKKLAWMNSIYISKLSHEEFLEYSKKFLEGAPSFVKDKWEFASSLAQGRIETFGEIGELFKFLEDYKDFDLSLFENKKNKLTLEASLNVLKDLYPQFEKLEDWSVENLNAIASNYAEGRGIKLGASMWPPRIATAGQMVTPGGMGEMMYLVGKEETLKRLRRSIERLEKEV